MLSQQSGVMMMMMMMMMIIIIIIIDKINTGIRESLRLLTFTIPSPCFRHALIESPELCLILQHPYFTLGMIVNMLFVVYL
jgi:hypothetical protein